MPSLGELFRRYRQDQFARELRSDWAVAVLYRYPSLVLVRLLAPLGVSPMAVTLAGLLIVLAMPAAVLSLQAPLAGPLLALLGIAFQLLDCVDGGLARALDRKSRLGAVVDSLVDMAQWGALYVSAGFVADGLLQGDAAFPVWTLVGAAAAWARLFARLVREEVPAGPEAKTAPLPPLTFGKAGEAFVTGLSGALAPLILFGFAAGLLHCVVGFLLVYSLIDIGDALWRTLNGARDLDLAR